MQISLRSIVKPVRTIGFFLLDTLAIASAKRATDTNQPSVAIFYLHGLGDLLLGLGMLNALIQIYKERGFSIHVYVDENARELAQAVEGVDHIITLRRHMLLRSPFYRWSALRRVAGAGHRAAVQPTYNRFFLLEDALMRATRSNERIGSSGSPMFINPIERFISDRWYSRLTKCAPQPMHEIDRNNEFLVASGLSSELHWPSLPASLIAQAVSDTRPVVLINISAAHILKSWPIERFEKLAHFIVRKTGKRIVFVGAADNSSPRKSFRRWNDKYFTDCVGKTDLPTLIGWIMQADLVIANDSAVMHFAALMRRKVIAVAGGGIPMRYHPYPQSAEERQPVIAQEYMPCYGCGWRCRYMNAYDQAAPCIRAVPTTRVARMALRELAPNTDDARGHH